MPTRVRHVELEPEQEKRALEGEMQIGPAVPPPAIASARNDLWVWRKLAYARAVEWTRPRACAVLKA